VKLLRPTHPYVATWTGFVYVAFVIDTFARRIVGWRVSRTAMQASFWTLWNRLYTIDGRSIAGSCTTAIEAANTSAFDTPSAWPRRASSPPWAAWATLTTVRVSVLPGEPDPSYD